MKLAAIYNVFDGVELLKGSMLCLKDHVDLFIIVVQNVSNFGEPYDGFDKLMASGQLKDIGELMIIRYQPESIGGTKNETIKRNIGIEAARSMDCTHFLHLDCDEYYKDFGLAKEEYLKTGIDGSVCQMFTYFAKPTFRTSLPDNYFVPFIHKLKPDTLCGSGTYPYYVDPTRRINEKDVMLNTHMMHHFSWVRENIGLKVRNSSAKANILKSNLLEQYWSKEMHENPEGFFVDGFNQELTVVQNYFNIQV